MNILTELCDSKVKVLWYVTISETPEKLEKVIPVLSVEDCIWEGDRSDTPGTKPNGIDQLSSRICGTVEGLALVQYRAISRQVYEAKTGIDKIL